MAAPQSRSFDPSITPHRALASMADFAEKNPAPVFRCDNDGVVVLANQKARELLGVEPRRGDRCPRWARDLIEVAAGQIAHREMRLGGHDYQFTFVGGLERGDVSIYGADVTALKEAERRLKRSYQQLKELETLRAT